MDNKTKKSSINKKEVCQHLVSEKDQAYQDNEEYGFEYFTLNNSRREAGPVTHTIDFIWHCVKPGLKLIGSAMIVSSLLNVSGLVSFYDQIHCIHTESFTNTLIILMSLYLMAQMLKGTLAIIRKDKLIEEKMISLPFTISLALVVFMLLPVFASGSLLIQIMSLFIQKIIY